MSLAATLLALKHELVASGARVRFERRVKNLRALLDRVTADGFDAFATVDDRDDGCRVARVPRAHRLTRPRTRRAARPATSCPRTSH